MKQRTSKQHRNFWKNRKIDWGQSYFTPEHPHRVLILRELLRIPFKSILEVGCGAGANLFNIWKTFKGAEIGGIDINPGAIDYAKRVLPNTITRVLEVSEFDDIFISDKSIDVVITDATLIYAGPRKIKKVLKEIARVARNGVVFCEMYHPKWWQRLNVWWGGGYFLHNYPRLLSKAGFYNIKITKMERRFSPEWFPCGYIISAKI